MSRKKNSLQHDLYCQARLCISPDLTDAARIKLENRTRADIKEFTSWAKERGIKSLDQIDTKLINKYSKALQEDPRRLSGGTIHTKLKAVCNGAGIDIKSIQQPPRSFNSRRAGKPDSLQYLLYKSVAESVKSEKTAHFYKSKIKRFAKWSKEQGIGITEPSQINAEVIQMYQEYLSTLEYAPGRRYSPSTIHTYLSPVCTAAGISMREIAKDRRTAGAIVRGRDGAKNLRGQRQAELPQYQRLVTFARVVGIRRAEYGRLRGCDLIEAEDGRLYVRVARGKGGKLQMQLIAEQDERIVREIFAGIAPDQRVFTAREMKNDINLHSLRAAHAKECYYHYLSRIEEDPEYLSNLRKMLMKRFEDGNRQRLIDKHGPIKGSSEYQRRLKRFLHDIDDSTAYKLRGENRAKAIDLGLSTEYNRIALMAVSVLHLAHWRLDVTVVNYMIQ